MSGSATSYTQLIAEISALLDNIHQLDGAACVELLRAVKQAGKLTFAVTQDIDFKNKLSEYSDRLLTRLYELDYSIYDEQMSHSQGSHTLTERPRNAYAVTRRAGFWRNVHLMKDCGLVVYTCGGRLGGRRVMLGENCGEYPYLDILPGMEVEFVKLPDMLSHLRENYRHMDVLFVYGAYPDTPEYVGLYRELRPDGKVYLALDMSRYWSGMVGWGHPELNKLFEQCDYIATSCRAIAGELNRDPRVNFVCHYVANGFFNAALNTAAPDTSDTSDTFTAQASHDAHVTPPYAPSLHKTHTQYATPADKENVILSVGRIGTHQKNTEELLNAFALIADSLPDWKLRLAGSIDPAFTAFHNEYFNKNPKLKDRVTFVGEVTDKAALYREYARAKVFALTSRNEGGTPNVYAEALYHGCYFVVSGIDAKDDVTNNGKLGFCYALGNMTKLKGELLRTLPTLNEKFFETHIPRCREYADANFDWIRNSHKIVNALFV